SCSECIWAMGTSVARHGRIAWKSRLVTPTSGTRRRARRPRDRGATTGPSSRLSSSQERHDRQRVRQRLADSVPAARSRAYASAADPPEALATAHRGAASNRVSRRVHRSRRLPAPRIVAGRNYPAYSFTSHSADILELFLWACEIAGLPPRRAIRVTVSL